MTSRKLRPALVLLLVGIAASLFFPSAFADSNIRIVRVSYADGDVYLDRRDGRGFERAVMNMPVASGNRIQTGHGSLAELEFEDGDTIRLTPDTLVNLEQLSLLNSGQRYTAVQLEDGTAYFNLNQNRDDDFRILAGRQEVTLRKDSRFRLTVGQRQMELAVYKGEVAVSGPGTFVAVKKNETFNLDFEDPGRYYLARSVEEGAYDQWDHDRDSYRERYSQSSYYGDSGYGGYSSVAGYGWSDLNYYGNYIYIPGNGYVWRPYFVDASWSPYLNGAWVYYPGFGYVWVSAYPWGWLPYHYGGWYYYSGYGWCWQGGRNRGHWNNWQPVTPVHHAPRGYQPPVAPSTPGGGIVPVGSGPHPIFPDREDGDRGAPGRKRVITMDEIRTERNPKGNPFRGGITTTQMPSEPVAEKSRGGSTNTDRGGTPVGGGQNGGSSGGDSGAMRGRALDRDSGVVSKGNRGSQEAEARGMDEMRPGSKSIVPENSGSGSSSGGSGSRVYNGGGARRSFDGGGSSSSPPSRSASPSYRSSGGGSGGYSGGKSAGGGYNGGGGGGRSSGGGGGGTVSKGSASSPR